VNSEKLKNAGILRALKKLTRKLNGDISQVEEMLDKRREE
jgi:hypothetical protein